MLLPRDTTNMGNSSSTSEQPEFSPWSLLNDPTTSTHSLLTIFDEKELLSQKHVRLVTEFVRKAKLPKRFEFNHGVHLEVQHRLFFILMFHLFGTPSENAWQLFRAYAQTERDALPELVFDVFGTKLCSPSQNYKSIGREYYVKSFSRQCCKESRKPTAFADWYWKTFKQDMENVLTNMSLKH